LLRDELRYDVEVVSEDDFSRLTSSLDDFEFIAKETFDANLEVWMSSEKKAKSYTWVDRNEAVNAGSHKLLSYSGIYVPWYDGDVATSQGKFFTSFRSPDELQKYTNAPIEGEAAGDTGFVCRRNEWNCSNFTWFPSYCRDQGLGVCGAQLLRGTTGWYQGLFEQRIESNGLNISAVYTPWSTVSMEVWKAYANNERFLFVNWEPNMPITGVGSNFQRVQFTPYWFGGCEEAGDTPVGGTSCDDPPAPLVKIVSKTLAESTDAFYFASAFALNQDDYDVMFEEYSLAGESLENASAVACSWLVRMGSERYGEWIQFTNRKALEVNFEGCWNYVWVQLGLLILSIFARESYIYVTNRRKQKRLKLLQEMSEDPGKPLSSSSLRKIVANDALNERHRRGSLQVDEDAGGSRHAKLVRGVTCQVADVSKGMVSSASRAAVKRLGAGANATEFRHIMDSNELGFFSMRRDEKAFIGDEAIFLIPERGQSTFRVNFDDSQAQIQLFWYLVYGSMKGAAYKGLQYALAVGAMGTLVHIFEDLAVQNGEHDTWTSELGVQMTRIVSDFSAVPALLIVFRLMSQISHWRMALGYGGSICGRMGDLCLIISSIVGSNDDDVCERERVRKLQYKFYRYLNAIHLLAYQGLDARVPSSASDICDHLRRAGLLTDDEAPRLASTERAGMSYIVLSWVATVWHKEIEQRQAEGDNHPNGPNFMEKLMALRSLIGCLREASNYEREPEVANGMTYAVTYVLFFFVAIAYPASLYTTADSGTCLQPWSCFSAAIFFITYDGLLSMQRILERSPYDRTGDCVNVDCQLCGMEEVTFYMIRSAYEDFGDKRSASPPGPPLDMPSSASEDTVDGPRRRSQPNQNCPQAWRG
jgi:hypothetical protein